jgi:hypothetical protein
VNQNPVPRDSISFVNGQMVETTGSTSLTIIGAFSTDTQFDLAINNGFVTGVV